MINQYKIIKESKDPRIIVVTPLLPGDKISKDTKRSIKRNSIEYSWITSTGNNNIPTNVELGLKWYLKRKRPDYVLPLDNDIILGRYMLDRLVYRMDKVKKGYCFASFKFQGYTNVEFKNDDFDISKLLQSNYISSNSLIHIDSLIKIGWFVKDEKYKRLLDWALWLKFLLHGYGGIPCPEAKFIAISSEKDISSQGSEDYKIKSKRVIQDFVKPFVDRERENIENRYSDTNTNLQ